MSVIESHDITLYGGTGNYDIILRPLCDGHLPFLYKWNADPELLFWTEGGEDIERSYGPDTVHAIYGSVSQNALCFLIEVNGEPVGECWLQKMNLPHVKAMYPEDFDVRRIDMAIGEKSMWGKGIGTALIRMLVDYAFSGEYADVLHCFNEDYNPRARRCWEKNGFSLILSEELPQPQKGKLQHHFRLTREEYIARRRAYAAVATRFGGLDARRKVIILTDNDMADTASHIRAACAAFVKSVEVINLDGTDDRDAIYALEPDDLLVLHIGIESWTGRHSKMAYAFGKPEGIEAKYICIRPTVTPRALLEGLDTPLELTESIVRDYCKLSDTAPLRVTAKSGTNISLVPYKPWIIPFVTREPGANAYLPPAEVSYNVRPGTANGVIVADVTVGELRVRADLVDAFGLVDEPVALYVENGAIVDITGGATARKLKTELWKLPDCCRKIVELGIGLSRMTPSGIIGIDESIAGTCHFGIGNGSGNDAPIHLDVVIGDFEIVSEPYATDTV